ncbi:MAG: glycosyltransferase family 2 protein [Deltaproteobacteria bacterium]|nr:glycosyltransferase family 2 protein [Deltaproteobacteria bacterium]
MANPKVSVLMAVHNGLPHVGAAIESVLAQTFKDFEFLIYDDGSTDGTPQLLAGLHDPRVRVVRHERAGLTVTLNRGIEAARGLYLARLDADDLCLPERLERQVAYLDANLDATLVCSRVSWIDENGAKLADWPADVATLTPEAIRVVLPRENCIAHSSVVVRTSVLKRRGYNPRARAGQDYERWLALVSSGGQIHKLAEPLVVMRQRAASVTHASQGAAWNRKNVVARLLCLEEAVTHGRISSFELRVATAAAVDATKLALKTLFN